MIPASLVACRWASSKYAGTVMTASVTSVPRKASASRLSFCRILAEISGGRELPVFDLHAHVAVGTFDHFVGDDLHLFAYVGELAPHEALDGEDGVLRVGDRLALGHGTDQLLPGLGESHNGRGGAATLGVGDDGRLAAFQHGHGRVGRAQVDADDLAHYISSELMPMPSFISMRAL